MDIYVTDLRTKWHTFKELRSKERNTSHFNYTHPCYMTILERESLIDTLFKILEAK